MANRWIFPMFLAGMFAAFAGQLVLRHERAPGITIAEHVETIRGGEHDGLGIAMRIVRRNDLEGPVPGIVFSHGFMASGELYDANYILPLARAGYVVASISARGHGDSGGAIPFPRAFGETGFRVLPRPEITTAMDVLRKLPGVDPARIGLMGHSMGGHLVTDTALLADGESAVVAVAGISETNDWSGAKNLLFLNCEYDQYIFPARSHELAAGFSDGNITVSGQESGDFADGTARGFILFPNCDHLMETYHPGIFRAALSWFDRALKHQSAPVAESDLWTWYLRGWAGSGLTIAGILLAAGALVWAWGSRTGTAQAGLFPLEVHELSGKRVTEAVCEALPGVETGETLLLPGRAGKRIWTLIWLVAPLTSIPFVSLWNQVPLALSGPAIAGLWGGGVLSAIAVMLGTTEDERAGFWECFIRGVDLRNLGAGLLAGVAACAAIALAFTGVLLDYWPTPRKWGFAVLLFFVLLPPLLSVVSLLHLLACRAGSELRRLVTENLLLLAAGPVMLIGQALFRWTKIMPLEWIAAATVLWLGHIPLLLLRRRDEIAARALAWAMLAAYVLANLLPVRIWE